MRGLTLRRDLDAALPGPTPHAAGRRAAAANTWETYDRGRALPAGRRRRGERRRWGEDGARRHLVTTEHLLPAGDALSLV